MVAEILILLAAISGSSLVLGTFGLLWHRVIVLERKLAAVEGERVAPRGAVRAGRHQLVDAREALESLHERVDFLERLLDRSAGTSLLRAPGGERSEVTDAG